MQKIAALLTCFNRKEKTLKALASLYKAKEHYNKPLSLNVYLTDDGSTDGTSEAVSKYFPEVNILKGTGNLFWAEGMRFTWENAIKNKYDAYLLINDDTELYVTFFEQLLKTNQYSLTKYNRAGIYIGSTEDKFKKVHTYSGSIITNNFLYIQKMLIPNGTYQKCDIGNANIMLVPNEVVEQLGILTKGYAHGKADYDYTLMASRKGIPVLIAPEYCGHCINDHIDYYQDFNKKSIFERKRIIQSPTLLDFKSHTKFMWKFFPLRAPLVEFFGWFKIYFPSLYLITLTKRKRRK